MSEPIKVVEGKEHLIRDMNSNAIINTDNSAYENRKKQKANARRVQDEKLADKERISTLEGEVNGLKLMMEKLMKKLG